MKPSLVGNMEYPDFLAHYGVKGMRWGKRKNKPSISDLSDEYLKARNERARLEATYKRDTVRTNTKLAQPKRLSDAELKARINRLTMEKTYNELTKGDRDRQAAGRKKVFDVMTVVAQNLLTDLIKTGAKTAWDYGSGSTTKDVQFTPALPPGIKAIGR